MIIEKASIKKFRGFHDVELELGKQLTVIAGQNGTQKTTVLGILSQPFTITDDTNPMKTEKPLSGGSYKSAFSDKFKLSETFDKPKTHEWTLHLTNDTNPFVIESIKRGKNQARFWQKGTREKGSGYIQLPVIYLSLMRLIPIGEDLKLKASSATTLSDSEKNFYKEWHNKILLSSDNFADVDYLQSPSKDTLGMNTNLYDWKQNSSGQDNIGKILLAVLSFKRLKEKYPNEYTGGILAIDELDATLYPASQIELINALRKFSSKYNIQIIFTTHSLSILEHTCLLQKELKNKTATKDQVKVVFLEKLNSKVEILQDVTFNTIKHRLNVTIEDIKSFKVDVFTEDKEAAIFVKALLKTKASKLKFHDCTLPCSSLIDLASRKIPSFIFPRSIIFLDGDVNNTPAEKAKIKKLNNVLVLPSNLSPERLLAKYLNELDDKHELWKSINTTFNKQYCFKKYTLSEIDKDRDKAKLWFNSHLKHWGTNAAKVFNPWIKDNKVIADKFVSNFISIYNKVALELAIDKIS